MILTNDKVSRSTLACTMLLLLGACATQQPSHGERFRSGATMEPMPVQAGDHLRPARRIRGDAPIVPISAALSGTPGFACLGYTVDPQGQVSDLKVVKASAPNFGVHAAHAVKDWVFEPALREGQPFASSYRQYFGFNGEDKDTDRQDCVTSRPPVSAAGNSASPRSTGSSAGD